MKKINIAKVMKIMKIIIISFVIIQNIMLFTVSGNVYAKSKKNKTQTSKGDVFSIGQNFIKMGENEVSKNNVDTSPMWTVLKNLVNCLIFVGFGISIVKGLLIIPTLKSDNPQDRANAKQTLISFVIKVVLLAAATRIWAFVITTIDDLMAA